MTARTRSRNQEVIFFLVAIGSWADFGLHVLLSHSGAEEAACPFLDVLSTGH
ncbi:hypothetical protein [[Kitasatospora] papulosa]|uniref:hypothetical protein n=1 Tax=[Kitasatospora] papulosa TaxID=1464011 RepID=UPI00380D4155